MEDGGWVSTARLGMNRSEWPVVAEKQSRLMCVEMDSGVACMCGSLCSLVCQQKDFVFKTSSHWRDCMRGITWEGPGRLKTRRDGSVLDEL